MRDKFTNRAYFEGYLARSIFKLKSIDNKFKIFKRGDQVLDLGASPGSWSQYVLEKGGTVDAVDIDRLKVKDVNFIKADFLKDSIFEKIKSKYDIVISDAAPNTTGILDTDNYRSFELSSRALEIANKVLNKDGKFVCKIFQSSYFDEFRKEMKKIFKTVKTVKPEASKKKSKEMYLVGFNKV